MKRSDRSNNEPLEHTAVRLSKETLERVDAMCAQASTESHVVSRSELLRGLILERLDALDENPELVLEEWVGGGWEGPSEEAYQAWLENRKPRN